MNNSFDDTKFYTDVERTYLVSLLRRTCIIVNVSAITHILLHCFSSDEADMVQQITTKSRNLCKTYAKYTHSSVLYANG